MHHLKCWCGVPEANGPEVNCRHLDLCLYYLYPCLCRALDLVGPNLRERREDHESGGDYDEKKSCCATYDDGVAVVVVIVELVAHRPAKRLAYDVPHEYLTSEVLGTDQGVWQRMRGEAKLGAGVWDRNLDQSHGGILVRGGYRGEEEDRIEGDLCYRPVAYLLLLRLYHLLREQAGRLGEPGGTL